MRRILSSSSSIAPRLRLLLPTTRHLRYHSRKMSTPINKTAHAFDRTRFEALLSRRFFFAPSFEIYGGCAGFFDYGPPGSALQTNIIQEFRRHFIIEDHMLELDTTIMTPAAVFETSGHVSRFADWMVKDLGNGEVIRADHLLGAVLKARLEDDKVARGEVEGGKGKEEEGKKRKKKGAVVVKAPVKLEDEVVKEYETILAKLDNYTGPELGSLISTHQILNPDSGNALSEPISFNLMFQSSIGPTGAYPGYLRPETAQGHFLNFARLLDFNNGRLPFSSAQIGRSFRNEISPRAGLLRVREFNMAEIEHYVDPEDKSHPRFDEIAHIELDLLDRETQASGLSTTKRLSIGHAVSTGTIANQTLAYFLARISLFLLRIGIHPSKLRFRQHMSNEMAHYATDCWDAEILNHLGGGWTECVGCADRAAYDLGVHAKRTGRDLSVRVQLREPVVEERWVAEVVKREVGRVFKGEAGVVMGVIAGWGEEEMRGVKGALENGPVKITLEGGKEVEITKEMVSIEKKVFKQSVREFIPNVIEPSFGLGRILYCLLEHSYWSREQDVERGVLSLPTVVAPTKVLIVPLSAKAEFDPLVKEVSSKLRKAGIFSRVDDSSVSIGKRYARNDELGTPFGVTLDFASVQNRTMTLRERDTTEQLIGSIDDVIAVVADLCEGKYEWKEATEKLKKYDGVQDVE